MTPRKLFVAIARFPYGGNGGSAAEHPAIGDWLCRTILTIHKDCRCEADVAMKWYADTPIPMTRNLALREARERGADLLVMVDSDQWPDLRLAYDPTAKPFWDSSFDFFYRHYDRGPCVIAAPYCGPPPHPHYGGHSNIYVFQWASGCNDREEASFGLKQFSREEAAIRAGIERVAALPTGLCMVDLRVCNLLEPPWFDYEWEDKYRSAKASTEDVFFTRNCELQGIPQYVNWDAWAGHIKPWTADKPSLIRVEEIQKTYRRALERNLQQGESVVNLNSEKSTEEIVAELGGKLQECAETPLDERESWIEHNRRELTRVMQQLQDHGLEIRPRSDFPGSIALGKMLPEADREVLKNLVESISTPPGCLNILEIGSWTGNSARTLLASLNGNAGVVHCVDTWQGSLSDPSSILSRILGGPDSLRAIFRHNLREELAEGRVVMHEGLSTEIAAHWDQGKLNLIFIDGDHSYEAVRADIESWYKHLDARGILCGHDYCTPEMPGVARAVNEQFGSRAKLKSNIWYIEPE